MITKDSVKKACKLSRIKVSDDEIDYFSSQVQLIMNIWFKFNNCSYVLF